ncbi:TPA: distal tail protein Dit [Bacillus anthracis]|nr:phage tail family protein [Bacillus cereus biovar anthracis]
MDTFTFGGENSSDYNLFVAGERDFSSSERDVTKVKVLGRDGDCIIDNNRNENYQRTLECYLVSKDWRNLHEAVRKVRNWLHRDSKYKELKFSYEEDFFYQAVMTSQIKAEMIDVQIARLEVTFELKPFLYFIDSFATTTKTSEFSIFNPSSTWALPYIKITGEGKIDLHIGYNTYAFENIDGWIEVDSEMKVVYKRVNGIVQNRSDRMKTRFFPNFKEGYNNVSWTGKVTSLIVQPRWRSR